jgi:REP element-mobilizing transposase RayT
MASTYLSLHYHLVFSTKNRVPFIEPEWSGRLHEYMGGTIRGLGGTAEAIGGVEDHIHALVELRATHCLADFMRELKKATSVFIHEEVGTRKFAWQEGYAAFTVSATAVEAVRHYIREQAEHHRTRDFLTELREMLERAGVKYDARFLR